MISKYVIEMKIEINRIWINWAEIKNKIKMIENMKKKKKQTQWTPKPLLSFNLIHQNFHLIRERISCH